MTDDVENPHAQVKEPAMRGGQRFVVLQLGFPTLKGWNQHVDSIGVSQPVVQRPPTWHITVLLVRHITKVKQID